eukprot:TRINITY_DN7575_c0_g1_i2.p2 TRINITY_DN7575_c0_g1~~TRINITY_DN7575_c0_g1_i2.p2  ORF type:complete len:102 (+),score=15.71 TRINITY_DN7575_c0_g1_i2:262-567(+)
MFADDTLECRFCWETLKQPVLLDCVHSVCLSCADAQLAYLSLHKQPAPDPAATPDRYVTCPHDSTRTTVGDGGAQSLKPNRHLAEVVNRHLDGAETCATPA